VKRIRGWAFDILVGWVMGSIPLGIACGVVGAFVGAEVAFSAAGVLMGTILGIVFMRRRRWLRAEEAGGGTEPVDEAQNSRTWSWLRVVAVALGVCLVGGLIASNVLLWLRAEDARNDLRDVRRDAANTAALARTGCDDSFGFGSASPAVCDSRRFNPMSPTCRAQLVTLRAPPKTRGATSLTFRARLTTCATA
jgi:hypothetical protein